MFLCPQNAGNTSVPKWQFNGNSIVDGSLAAFMLNTDFELFYELTLDSNAKSTCTLSPSCGLSTPNTCSGSCPVASTFNQAQQYSKVRHQNCKKTLLLDQPTGVKLSHSFGLEVVHISLFSKTN